MYPCKRTVKIPQQLDKLPVIGWRECVKLPDLGITKIKAKIDVGTRSSTLQASETEYFKRDATPFVRFNIFPQQNDTETVVQAEARLIKQREIRNETGNVQLLPVIQTWISLGEKEWPIELILISHDSDRFRLCLGRKAVRRRFLVDPGLSFVKSQPAF